MLAGRRAFARVTRLVDFGRARTARGTSPSTARKGKWVPATAAAYGHDDGASAVRGRQPRICTVLEQQFHEFDVAGTAGSEKRSHATIGRATEVRTPIEL